MPLDVESQAEDGSYNEDAHVFPANICSWSIDWSHSHEDNFNEIHTIATAQLVLTSHMASRE